MVLLCFFFFFQAEDGIRDLTVTGVQTCALPIFERSAVRIARAEVGEILVFHLQHQQLAAVGQLARSVRDEEIKARRDRKSTRLNSSHSQISYAVFCLKKKKNKTQKLIYSKRITL